MPFPFFILHRRRLFFLSVARSTPEVTLSDDSDMETESPFIEEDFGAYRGARQSALIPDE